MSSAKVGVEKDSERDETKSCSLGCRPDESLLLIPFLELPLCWGRGAFCMDKNIRRRGKRVGVIEDRSTYARGDWGMRGLYMMQTCGDLLVESNSD